MTAETLMYRNRLNRGDKLVVATHNQGKLREIRALLAPFGCEATSVGELGLPEPDETGHMFAENAAIKADAAAKATGLPALADDSGICVDALDGAPGLFSANWAGPGKDFAPAMERIWRELQWRGAVAEEQRRAHFVSALVLCWPDASRDLFEGRVFGQLVYPPRGNNGHGYDPMFVPDGFSITFGEMAEAEKNRISHRARSFEKFRAACLD